MLRKHFEKVRICQKKNKQNKNKSIYILFPTVSSRVTMKPRVMTWRLSLGARGCVLWKAVVCRRSPRKFSKALCPASTTAWKNKVFWAHMSCVVAAQRPAQSCGATIRSPTISLCCSEAGARAALQKPLSSSVNMLAVSMPPLITHANLFSPSICPSLRRRRRLDSITADAPLRSVILTVAVSSPSSYLILPRVPLSCRGCLLSLDAPSSGRI